VFIVDSQVHIWREETPDRSWSAPASPPDTATGRDPTRVPSGTGTCRWSQAVAAPFTKWACAAADPAVLYGMATAVMALGRIAQLKAAGRELPPAWR
jgi:hypothetical protein